MHNLTHKQEIKTSQEIQSQMRPPTRFAFDADNETREAHHRRDFDAEQIRTYSLTGYRPGLVNSILLHYHGAQLFHDLIFATIYPSTIEARG